MEILLRRDGNVATVTLNRPDRFNALTSEMRVLLRDVLDDVGGDDDVRAVVLTGAGRGFCSGQDLRDFGEIEDVTDVIRSEYNVIIDRLATMRKPVVAWVNGPCAGAGLGLALACDLRVLSEDAFLSCAFSAIGLVPDSGVSSGLVRLVGYERAFELAATARRVSAAEAVALGLALEAVPAADIEARVATLAATLAAGPTVALGLTKALLREAGVESAAASADREAVVQAQALATADHREGVQAFLAKRSPVFEGR